MVESENLESECSDPDQFFWGGWGKVASPHYPKLRS